MSNKVLSGDTFYFDMGFLSVEEERDLVNNLDNVTVIRLQCQLFPLFVKELLSDVDGNLTNKNVILTECFHDDVMV
jgi:hypothetical protein